MAVTIDELQVEVQEQPARPAAEAVAGVPSRRPVDLRGALDLICERDLRLKAD